MISKKSNMLGMLSVMVAGLGSESIMSAPKHGKTDIRYYAGTEGKNNNYISPDGSKPNKRRLKVKLARKANVQRLIKMK